MAIKKSELYSSLWASCDALRGGMDASQYKDYVLVLLFVKYVSDKYASQKDALIEVPKGGSFKDMSALKGQKHIGEGINTIVAKLAEANDLMGVINVADFNNEDKLGRGKDMVDRLTDLVAIFENPALDFSKNRADGDDILGDAYEYLMRNFATESGKSKGQFYTPAEVSRIMAKVIGINLSKSQSQTIYDPTCGSGSLLLKAADEAEKGVTIYGQENDNATAALAKMNMILHSNPTAEIWKDNTLTLPHFKNADGSLKTFDFAVANPPFSSKNWMNGLDPANDVYGRFEGYGVPPKKNGDYSFLLHLIRSIKSNGKGAIILPHGVLFRGNVEAEIRKNIIRKGYIKGVIGLPPNLFYGTGIPACIIVLDKENAESRKGIFIIDASKGFMKDGNKNRLREQDIHKIVDVFNKQMEVTKYSKMVSFQEIEKHEYNLNIPRYIDSQEEEDIQNIEAHLLGDIPNADIDALSEYWETYPSLKGIMFSKSQRLNYCKLNIPKDEIKHTIFSYPEFVKYSKVVEDKFEAWKKKNLPLLKGISSGTKPKRLIAELSEDLLGAFSGISLVDKYDIYQHLMVYWSETMQDDVYEIVTDGWSAGKEIEVTKKEWEGRIIPKALVIASYFNSEQKAIECLEAERDAITRQMEEIDEEQSGEDNLLDEVRSEKGKITKALIQKRIREIKNDEDAKDELKLIENYMGLLEKEAEASKAAKEAQTALDKKLHSKYKAFTEDEIKKLTVEEKWMLRVFEDVKSEMNRISQRLTQRIKELAERYETPLPHVEANVRKLTDKVDAHLKQMGYVWN